MTKTAHSWGGDTRAGHVETGRAANVGMFGEMTGPHLLPDEVPEADAVEQSLPVAPDAEPEIAESTDGAPLESTASDWIEQHREVDIDAEDDYR